LDPGSVARLIADLLIAVQSLTAYGAPDRPPSLEFVPGSFLQQQACERACAVYGWFPPGKTIYLDERLDPANDMRARGILVHELVHYLQQENQAFSEEAPCERWLARERQAFNVQYQWLVQEGVPLAAHYTYSGQRWRVDCDKDDQDTIS
jgi:hypothetical protein